MLLKIKKLQLQNLLGGFEWFDGQAENTERLVPAFFKSAKAEGADIQNYCGVTSVELNEAGLQQVIVFDQRQGKKLTLEADIIAELFVNYCLDRIFRSIMYSFERFMSSKIQHYIILI